MTAQWMNRAVMVGLMGAGALGVGCSHGSTQANRDTRPANSGYGASGSAGTMTTTETPLPSEPNQEVPAGNMGTSPTPDESGVPQQTRHRTDSSTQTQGSSRPTTNPSEPDSSMSNP